MSQGSSSGGKSSQSPATAGSFGAAPDSMANMAIGGYQGPNFFSGIANNAPGGAYTPPNQVAQTQQSQMQSQQAAPDSGKTFQPLEQRSFADQMNNSVQDYHLPGYGQPQIGPGQEMNLPLEQRSFADQINQYPQPEITNFQPEPVTGPGFKVGYGEEMNLPLEQRSFADQINQYPQPAVAPAPAPAAKLPALSPKPAPKPAPRPVAKPSPFKTAAKPVAKPAPFKPVLTRPGVQPILRTALKPPGR